MWSKSYSVVTQAVTKEQMWNLVSDVNHWHTWDKGIEFANLEGEFQEGNYFTLKPKGGPKVRIQLIEVVRNKKFVDFTKFPLAKMYGEHTFEETNEGLKITVTMKVEGILSALWVKLVAGDIVKGLPEDTAAQIKAAASR
jgi:Polyketide cyclase / dehydrase and lipid transport